MRTYPDVEVQGYGPGYRGIVCGPSLFIYQLTFASWKSDILEEHDRRRREEQARNVKEEFVACSSAAPFVVVSAPGSDGVHLVASVNGSVEGRSTSLKVNPLYVGHTSNNVAKCSADILGQWFDQIGVPQLLKKGTNFITINC